MEAALVRHHPHAARQTAPVMGEPAVGQRPRKTRESGELPG